MKKWENPNLINLSVKNTTKLDRCPVCQHPITPGKPNSSDHKPGCTFAGVSPS